MAAPHPPANSTSPTTPSDPTSTLLPPIPVPTHGPGGTFTIIAGTCINGIQPALALSTIRDTASWPKWNSFCPKAVIEAGVDEQAKAAGSGKTGEEGGDGGLLSTQEGVLNVGSIATIDVHMNGDGLVEGRKSSRTQGIVVTRVEGVEVGEVKEVTGMLGKAWAEGSTLLGEITMGEGTVKGYRIAWRSMGWSHWQLHSERVLLFLPSTSNGTIFISYETFGGILASVVKLSVGSQLIERFADYAKDLKRYLESGMSEGE